MKKLFLAIGVIALLIGVSTLSMGANTQSTGTNSQTAQASPDSVNFSIAPVSILIINTTVVHYEHVFGGKLLSNSLYKNITISGEYKQGFIGGVLNLLMKKFWTPKVGELVTIRITNYFGQISEGTLDGYPYVSLSSQRNNGWGFTINATKYPVVPI